MAQTILRSLLSGGDRRSIGNASSVARMAGSDAALLSELISLLDHDDPVVRMRSADALEKVSRTRPRLLNEYTSRLLELLGRTNQQEVHWHLFQLLPRLPLSSEQRTSLFETAFDALQSSSRIVAADALTALFAVAGHDLPMRERAVAVAEALLDTGTPSMRARARKLLRTPA